jgi:acetolactate synthase regulatory subunit
MTIEVDCPQCDGGREYPYHNCETCHGEKTILQGNTMNFGVRYGIPIEEKIETSSCGGNCNCAKKQKPLTVEQAEKMVHEMILNATVDGTKNLINLALLTAVDRERDHIIMQLEKVMDAYKTSHAGTSAYWAVGECIQLIKDRKEK